MIPALPSFISETSVRPGIACFEVLITHGFEVFSPKIVQKAKKSNRLDRCGIGKILMPTQMHDLGANFHYHSVAV